MTKKTMSKAQMTRMNILNNAFALIYKNGYQATSIDEIIGMTKVTKGAMYYHFKNKNEMGLALIKEVMQPTMYSKTIRPLTGNDEPQTELYAMMEGLLKNKEFFDVRYGCPAVNLIEEMAPLNTDFANALRSQFLMWKKAMVDYLENAKHESRINSKVNSEQVATFMLSGYSGIRNLGKILGEACYISYLRELKNYLNVLD